eukprot:228461-Prymnesium_polylepis.1
MEPMEPVGRCALPEPCSSRFRARRCAGRFACPSWCAALLVVRPVACQEYSGFVPGCRCSLCELGGARSP